MNKKNGTICAVFLLVFGKNLFLPGFFAALRAAHISGSAHMGCHSGSFESRHISVVAVFAGVVASSLFDSHSKTQANGRRNKTGEKA